MDANCRWNEEFWSEDDGGGLEFTFDGNRSIFSARLPKAVMDYSNVNLDASIAIFINSRVKIVFIGYI